MHHGIKVSLLLRTLHSVIHLMPLGIGIPRVCKTYSCLNVANLYKHVSVYIYVKPKIVAEEKNTLLVMG